MPLTLAKLSCGIIYTDSFCEWLERHHNLEAAAHPRRVLTLDYIRCASGPQRGRAWCQVHWLQEEAAPRHQVFVIGGVSIHFPKNTQIGLRERCLDCQNGQVVVIP